MGMLMMTLQHSRLGKRSPYRGDRHPEGGARKGTGLEDDPGAELGGEERGLLQEYPWL